MDFRLWIFLTLKYLGDARGYSNCGKESLLIFEFTVIFKYSKLFLLYLTSAFSQLKLLLDRLMAAKRTLIFFLLFYKNDRYDCIAFKQFLLSSCKHDYSVQIETVLYN